MTHAVQDPALPTLLVPVALEALVVNDLVNDNISFSLWQPNYNNLSNNFASPLSAPFDDQSQPPKNGVYVHWVLPDALIRGSQPQSTSTAAISTDPSTTDYPLVPNRWLVARIVTNSPTQHSLKAWVVQSDYLYSGTDRTQNGSNPFVDPNTKAFELTTLGKHFDLASWSEPASQPLFLKAVGPGNLTFAAHTYGAMDVFAFCDTLSDLPDPTKNAYDLSYVVLGWYSNTSHDILQGWTTADQWQTLMQTLNWTIPNWIPDPSHPSPPLPPVNQLPQQTLYHGMVYGVNWQNTALPSAKLDPSKLRVAIGNTGIDGFAALLEKVASDTGSPPMNTDLLEAFQYNLLPLLNETDGVAQVEMQATEPWYGSSSSGIYWQVVPVQRSNLDNTANVAAQLNPTQAAKLAQLNAIQTQLNQQYLQLQSRQTQLYDIWWKQQAAYKNGYTDGNTPEAGIDDPAWDTIATNISHALTSSSANSLIASVKQLHTAVESLSAQVPNPSDPVSILNYAQNTLQLPNTLELKAVPMPRFYHPTDPVLMIGGIEWPDRYIAGGMSNAGAPLPTRLANQLLTGLQVGNTAIRATDSQLAGAIPLLPDCNLPAGLTSLLTALLQEAFLVDPASASIIAARYNLDPQTVANAIAQKAQVGTYPAALSVFQWQQAWSPLFLEWEVNWYPTPVPTALQPAPYDPDNPSNPTIPTTTASINWNFDGQDYTWSGNPPDQSAPVQTYKGRIFLSPHITFGLIARLQQYLQGNPNADLQAISNLIAQIGDWNFLSQTLSGFCQDLIMQDISSTVPPTSPIAGDTSDIPSYIGAAYRSIPFTAPGAWSDSSQRPSSPADYFFPIRAGHFMFQNLRVVDRFGQILNLLQANDNAQTDPKSLPQGFQPIYGRGLKPDSANFPTYLIKQPPRIVQPAQLDFRCLAAGDDTQLTELNPLANPICGWLLPNHLDRSLSVYDAAGDPLGALTLVANSQGSYSLSWQSAPGITPPITPAQIADRHLQQFVQGILGLNDQGAGLQSLLQVIDETLWVVNPSGGDQELSLLIGRPIAVVRAKVQLQLSGDPVADQAWSQTLAMGPRGTDIFTNTTFAVKLGSLELLDDGLLGYFLNDNYQQFNAVHPGTNSPYIAPIGANNYIQLPINYASKPNQQQALLTMLVDPRGCIHATPGILPPEKLLIPATYTKPAAKLNVTFRVNSLLTEVNTIRLPIPSLKQANWSWIERSAPNTWNTSLPVVKANQKPRLADISVVRDGWLQLEDQES